MKKLHRKSIGLLVAMTLIFSVQAPVSKVAQDLIVQYAHGNGGG
ncbi:Phr family secreted Rap phosphatase inhibitor [Bacillus mycoides]|uniref:Uncharacterized protein n=1 Tax=Bacillus mycoides TaxID=1405 RepID=A0AAP8KUW1_BACMY|nr:Phr family secreted Rap phosphatase inhibitor [Bacillus mycoides]PJN52594.1 hypothetical protein BAWEI_57900 [Bacillus mycoides]PJN70624.1 hypothetical protein BACWE_25520 [Bacillus mycoides]